MPWFVFLFSGSVLGHLTNQKNKSWVWQFCLKNIILLIFTSIFGYQSSQRGCLGLSYAPRAILLSLAYKTGQHPFVRSDISHLNNINNIHKWCKINLLTHYSYKWLSFLMNRSSLHSSGFYQIVCVIGGCEKRVQTKLGRFFRVTPLSAPACAGGACV